MGSTVFGDFIFKDSLDRAILNSMKEFKFMSKFWVFPLQDGPEYQSIWVNIFDIHEVKA